MSKEKLKIKPVLKNCPFCDNERFVEFFHNNSTIESSLVYLLNGNFWHLRVADNLLLHDISIVSVWRKNCVDLIKALFITWHKIYPFEKSLQNDSVSLEKVSPKLSRKTSDFESGLCCVWVNLAGRNPAVFRILTAQIFSSF